MVAIWALLVGICKYETQVPRNDQDIWRDLLGADKDVDEVRHYLREDLKVPNDHIITLKDHEATRDAILHTFNSHLIENKCIRRGDAILFHFSGHGSRSSSPSTWPVVEQEDRKIEVILPHDVALENEDGDPVCGIPDRTLAALLMRVADAHGNNITVVLDCCHSGHGTRDESLFSVRGINPALVPPLRDDVDQEIWGPAEDMSRGGSTKQQGKSHVLIAACRKHQQALGGKRGGLLTISWLKALRDPEIRMRSYPELMKAISRTFDGFRKKYSKTQIDQDPHCEGDSCDRLVFQETTIDPRLFEVIDTSADSRYMIRAGTVQGASVGTLFEIYEVDPMTLEATKSLGTVITREVQHTCCFVQDLKLVSGALHYARMHLRLEHTFKYAITNLESTSMDANNFVQAIEDSMKNSTPEITAVVQQVNEPKEADLVLQVNSSGITLKRQDPILGALTTNSPHLAIKAIKNTKFPQLLYAIAWYNFYLSRDIPVHPFADGVDFKLHLLQNDPLSDFLDYDAQIKSQELKEEFPAREGEVNLPNSEDNHYAFVLHNNTETPLYAYLVYFDPATYQIEVWYSPKTDEPTLLENGGILQIGASPEHADEFLFYLRDGEQSCSDFVKVFLSDKPVKMSFIEQGSLIQYSSEGQRQGVVIEEGCQQALQGGDWDCITRKVTVTRELPRVLFN